MFERKNYPELIVLIDYINKHTRYDKMNEYEQKQYNSELYNGEVNLDVVPPEQAAKDIKRLSFNLWVGNVKRRQHDGHKIQNMKNERQIQALKIQNNRQYYIRQIDLLNLLQDI